MDEKKLFILLFFLLLIFFSVLLHSQANSRQRDAQPSIGLFVCFFFLQGEGRGKGKYEKKNGKTVLLYFSFLIIKKEKWEDGPAIFFFLNKKKKKKIPITHPLLQLKSGDNEAVRNFKNIMKFTDDEFTGSRQQVAS